MAVRFGPFALHPDRRQLLRDGVEVHLTPKAFDLLSLLIDRAPAVVSKAEFHERLWPATFVDDSTLVGIVKEVRRALEQEHDVPLIRTVHRVGYAFDAAVSTGTNPGTAAACWLSVGHRRLPLRHGANVIGRDPAAAIWLDVPGVSRTHAQILIEEGRATLEDLGSKNGTLLRGKRLEEPAALRNADQIQIATEILVFHESSGGLSTVTQ